ncbi:MAG TPA: ParB/RepB/Spo0J family partition protein [Alphaproteobacteria bacterium]|nr:ParB/RepB/Spo0J family partition protein [Alphaproteobacteria bacterium]USO05196.1 MAG: ParB/RepB/Spo0J family partition protein [Rhodospirillales bacterium]HOO82627.1 ParB/RepB/Spo0J family partition protein [Alphaproteobacteria bacterium]
MDPKSRGLGRGLNALFEDDEGVYPQVDPEGHIQGRKRDMVGIDQLEPGPGQPRTIFRDGALDELSESIKLHGVLQPLLVREHKDNSGQYQIIAGERRWRAAQKAQLHEVPVIVLSITDAEAFEIALIENLQREDLDPIDEATGYQKLIDEHEYTQEKLAESLGKSRSHIANMIRLLQLPLVVRDFLSDGKITIGHARALITVENAEALVKEVIAKNLSVRETEKLVAESQGRAQTTKVRASKSSPAKDVDTLALEEDISGKLGMRVSIDSRDGKSGRLSVQFKTLDQLDVLIRRLSEESGSGRLSA